MRRTLLLPLLCAAPGGCATTAMMRSLPLDAGTQAQYALAADTIATVFPAVLAGRGLRVVESAAADSTTSIVIAKSEAGLFSYGEYVRVLAESRPGRPSVVRLAARSQYLLDASGRSDRVTPRLLQSLDSALGPGAVRPFVGDRLRGRATAGGPRLAGRVSEGPDGGLRLTPDGGGPATPVADLQDVAIYRGRYSHRSEGSTVGLLLGLVVGAVAAQPGDAANSNRDATVIQGALLGMVIGAVAGFIAGEAFRTTVWSEVR